MPGISATDLGAMLPIAILVAGALVLLMSEVFLTSGRRGFMAGNGNFYAVRVLEAMSVNPDRGAIRLSLLHYNSSEEVDGVIEALDEILGPQVAARRTPQGDSRPRDLP